MDLAMERSSRRGLRLSGALLAAILCSSIPAPAGGGTREVRVGDEIPAADPSLQPLIGHQENPGAAKGDSVYLVVWTEEIRNHYDVNSKVYAARVSLSGVVLDPRGFLVDDFAQPYQNPSVAWNGDRFLIAWEDQDGVSGLFVSESGEVTGQGAFSISAPGGWGLYPRVAGGAGDHFVVWATTREIHEESYEWIVEGVFVGPNGPTSDPRTLSEGFEDVAYPVASFGPDGVLVVWTEPRGIVGRTVSAHYDLGELFEVAGHGTVPLRIASGTDGYFVAWQRVTGTSRDKRYAVHGVAIEAGTLSPSEETRIAADDFLTDPDVVWTGDSYAVLWSSRGSVVGWRVSSQGIPEESFFVAGTQSTYEVALAGDNRGALAVWGGDPGGTSQDIVGRLLDPSSDPLGPPFAVTTALAPQGPPSIAWTGTRHVIAWLEPRWPDLQLVSSRFEAGEGLDGSGLELLGGGDAYLRGADPVVASVQGAYLGARPDGWSDPGDVTGRFVRANSGEQRYVTPATDRPRRITDLAVATARYRYLFVWRESEDSRWNKFGSLLGALVDRNGWTYTPEFPITAGDRISGPPGVAAMADRFLVVWGTRRRNGPSQLWAASVTPRAEVEKIRLPFSGMDRLGVAPVVESDGANYLLVWRDIDGASISRLHALLLTEEGRPVSEETTITTSRARLGIPKVAWDGSNYVVVWSNGSDVFGSRVTFEGRLVDETPFTIAASPDIEKDPEAVGTTPGVTAVTYRRLISAEEYESYRVFFRLVEE